MNNKDYWDLERRVETLERRITALAQSIEDISKRIPRPAGRPPKSKENTNVTEAVRA